MAIATRISTGTRVQTTSSEVLCEVRDGVGLAPRRKRIIVIAKQPEDEHADDHAQRSSQMLWKPAASLADRR